MKCRRAEITPRSLEVRLEKDGLFEQDWQKWDAIFARVSDGAWRVHVPGRETDTCLQNGKKGKEEEEVVATRE